MFFHLFLQVFPKSSFQSSNPQSSSSQPYLRSSRLPLFQQEFPESSTQTSGLSPFGEGRIENYGTPLLSRQSYINTAPSPPETQQKQAQNLAPPARAPRLRTSRIFEDTSDDSDTGYMTSSETPYSRLSSQNPYGYETDTAGYTSASETPPQRQAQNLPPFPMAEPPQYKTSYYSPTKSVVQEPIPDLNQLPSMPLSELHNLNERLIKSQRSIRAMINGKKRKRNPTQEDKRLLREYEQYKNELNSYLPVFREHYRNRKKQGQGSNLLQKPEDLIKRLELLDGSLKAGNNGVLNEYIHILHHMRDKKIITNKQLNSFISNISIN